MKLHVSDISSVHHQESDCTHSNGICRTDVLTYTIVVCTVKNSWWWTEELSETCRVSFYK